MWSSPRHSALTSSRPVGKSLLDFSLPFRPSVKGSPVHPHLTRVISFPMNCNYIWKCPHLAPSGNDALVFRGQSTPSGRNSAGRYWGAPWRPAHPVVERSSRRREQEGHVGSALTLQAGEGPWLDVGYGVEVLQEEEAGAGGRWRRRPELGRSQRSTQTQSPVMGQVTDVGMRGSPQTPFISNA